MNPLKIIVNGREHLVRVKTLSYKAIVKLAGAAPRRTDYTVTYFCGPRVQGSLAAGCRVNARDGMVFSAMYTGHA